MKAFRSKTVIDVDFDYHSKLCKVFIVVHVLVITGHLTVGGRVITITYQQNVDSLHSPIKLAHNRLLQVFDIKQHMDSEGGGGPQGIII